MLVAVSVFWRCAIYLFDLVVGLGFDLVLIWWLVLACYCFTFDYLFGVVGA